MTADKPLKNMPESEVRSGSAMEDADFDLEGPKSEVADRLREAIRLAGGNQVVAAKSGVPLGTLNNYVRGVNEPKAMALGALATACGVSLDWLVFGRGGKQEQSQSQSGGSTSGGDLQRIPGEVDSDFAFLPRYAARASAGSGQLAISDEVTDILAFRRDWLRRMGVNPAYASLMTAEGDSMAPTIPDGSLMLIDGAVRHASDIRNGRIYVMVRNDLVIVKRIQIFADGRLALISDNPLYEREVLTREDLDGVHIAGRVHWIGRTI